MTTTAELLAEAVSASKTDSNRSEALYKQILSSSTSKPSPNEDNERQAQNLRDQETALVNLGQLYRDQKCVQIASCMLYTHAPCRNAAGVAEVITLSRSFMSSTAKAKTAKLSRYMISQAYIDTSDSTI